MVHRGGQATRQPCPHGSSKQANFWPGLESTHPAGTKRPRLAAGTTTMAKLSDRSKPMDKIRLKTGVETGETRKGSITEQFLEQRLRTAPAFLGEHDRFCLADRIADQALGV